MKFVVAGGSGFVGSALVKSLSTQGHDVVVLSRSERPAQEHVRFSAWNGAELGAWAGEIDGAHAVINLAGRTVAAKWTLSTQREILESRVNSTKVLGEAMARAKNPPKIWVNASAIGYYGDQGATELDESGPAGSDREFLPRVAAQWEAAARTTCPANVQLTILRIGMVLGLEEGALPPLANLARRFMGGHPGKGQNYFSWIHLTDLVRLIEWCALEYRGPIVNGTAPAPVTSADFMTALRRRLHRPAAPPVPLFALQLGSALLGLPDPELIVTSARVMPQAALRGGFSFQFSNLEAAFGDLFPEQGN